MISKKVDLRVKILSYINDKNENEYYPVCGFPVELFIINQHLKIKIFTTELLNASNFIFYINNTSSPNVAITLKKMIFIGNYNLYDHFAWQSSVSNLKTVTVYLSHYLDTKIIQIENNCKNRIISVSGVFSGSIWFERENSEMFNIFYKNLKDSRKLLLDYTTNRGVLLKSYNNINFSNNYKNYAGVNFF